MARLLLLFCQMKMMDLSNGLLNICAYVHSSMPLSIWVMETSLPSGRLFLEKQLAKVLRINDCWMLTLK